MMQFLQKRWFLIALTILISSGLGLGWNYPVFTESATDVVSTKWLTAFVLFLMAFSLDSRALAASTRAPGPVILGYILNFGLAPLLAFGLMGIQLTEDFRMGLMIAATVPCTLAAASVWTRKAKGNDAVSLLVTLTTNGSCFLVSPFLLALAIRYGGVVSRTPGEFTLDTEAMVWRLFVTVLVPTFLGQVARQPAFCRKFATDFKIPIGVVAQSLILVMVFVAASGAGVKLTETGVDVGIISVAVVWLSTIAVHLVTLFAAIWLGGRLGFSRPDRAAVAFAGSQKTLPVGILLASEVAKASGLSFALFPMLMYHASQLFIDTAIADQLASLADREELLAVPETNPA